MPATCCFNGLVSAKSRMICGTLLRAMLRSLDCAAKCDANANKKSRQKKRNVFISEIFFDEKMSKHAASER